MNLGLAIALVAGAVWACCRAPAPARAKLRERAMPWVPLVVAGAAFVVVHTLRAVELRAWYFSALLPIAYPLPAVAANFVAAELGRTAGLSRRALAVIAATVAVAAVVALVAGWRAGAAVRCGDTDVYDAVAAINARLRTGTTIGSFNAGLYGYFYTRGTVVDLDGLVDNDAYRHLRDRSLGAYLAARNVASLVDPVGSVEAWRSFWWNGAPPTFGRPERVVTLPRDRAHCGSGSLAIRNAVVTIRHDQRRRRGDPLPRSAVPG